MKIAFRLYSETELLQRYLVSHWATLRINFKRSWGTICSYNSTYASILDCLICTNRKMSILNFINKDHDDNG